MTSETSVKQLVDQFYVALNKVYAGDAAPMVALWSVAPYVSAMHSLGDHEVGLQQVTAEWNRVASRVSQGQVSFEQLQLRAHGDLGFVIGFERGSVEIDGKNLEVNVRVTNIFEKSSGEWKVVHHHADSVQAITKAAG